MKFLDIPKYRIRPSPERFLIDRILLLIGLGILLYIGIFVNYYLLGGKIPTYTNWIIITGIFLLMILELILCYVKYGKYIYEFYEKKVMLNCGKTRSIEYSNIVDIKYSTNILDRILKTGSILLHLKDGAQIKLKYLHNPNQAFFLIQKYKKEAY